jgi:shikimate kinase
VIWEKAVIEEISTEDNLIIATGGGSVTIESNMEN